MPIRYKKGYKYQLVEALMTPLGDYFIDFGFRDADGYIALMDGVLMLSGGYAWDGPSGPTIDTKSFMRGSLVHDALYEAIRKELLPPEARQPADYEIWRICREDGMCWIRSQWVYYGLRFGGWWAAWKKNRRKIHVAP